MFYLKKKKNVYRIINVIIIKSLVLFKNKYDSMFIRAIIICSYIDAIQIIWY